MTDYAATGEWSIYSVQKTLPVIGQVGSLQDDIHSYLVLVDDTGKPIHEMQGKYSKDFTLFGTSAGNYLQVEFFPPDKYMGEQSVLSKTLVMSGSQNDMTSAFNQAFDTVATALNKTHDLYNGASLFSDTATYNSNSVWFTAMKALGVADPFAYEGGYKGPGSTIDLSIAPSNNSYVGTSDDAQWKPNPLSIPRGQSSDAPPIQLSPMAAALMQAKKEGLCASMPCDAAPPQTIPIVPAYSPALRTQSADGLTH